MIHIKGHDQVELITSIRGESNERNVPVASILDDVDRFGFGEWIGHEEFCIELRSRFVVSPDLEKVLQIVGKIDVEEKVRVEDDGISQKVTVNRGVSGGMKEPNVPAPVTVALRPYRTFTEIDQPESEFLFRIRQSDRGVACALFEADGGKWRSIARESIRAWLEAEIQRAFTSGDADVPGITPSIIA